MTTQLPPPIAPVPQRLVRPTRPAAEAMPAIAVVAQGQDAGTESPVTAAPIPVAPPSAPPAKPSADAAPAHVEQANGILPLLSRWTGGMATVWTYTVSHGKLVLRFTRPNARGNLHLTCYDCRRICAPTFWGNTVVSVTEEATPEGRRYVIRDEAANVEIRCGHLSAAENVEPVY